MALTISINQAAAFTVNVGVPGPTGPQGPAGPPGPAGGGSVWGNITGTLSNQTDLASALAGKYPTTNPAGYIDLTTAGLYFYPITGNPGGYATQAWVIGQNYITISALDSYATQTWVNTQLSGYALQSWVTDRFYPLSGNPSGFLTSASLSGYATESWVTARGYITASSLSPYLTSATAASTYQTISGMSSYLTTSTAASTYQTQAGMSSYLTTSAAASTYAVIARGLPASGTAGQVLTKVNGTDYNASWTTFTPGDRYLTTSTTSNTISNGTKTFIVGTGLSYTTTQDLTIASDSANHMHGTVTTYNSSTGQLVVDISNHTGAGTHVFWTVNVGGTVPAQSVSWGDIVGTLGDQSDLATALNAKLETSTAASTYLALSGGTVTGNISLDGASIVGGNYSASGVATPVGFGARLFSLADGNVFIQTGSGGTQTQEWKFDNAGVITFPDETQQSTAATTFNGGSLPLNAVIDMSSSTTDSEVGGWGFGVEYTGVSAEQSTVEYNQIRTKNADYSFTATPTEVRVFEDTNSLGVTIAHDSIAIQHIDTPNVTAYMTNEYIGFEDMGGTPHSTFIEHDVITVQDATDTTQMRSTGLTLSAGGSITFGDSTVQTTAYTGGGGGGIPDAPIDNYIYGRINGFWYRLPGFSPFTNVATNVSSIASWSFYGANIYLSPSGGVSVDTASSVYQIGINGGDTSSTVIDLSAMSAVTGQVSFSNLSQMTTTPILPSSSFNNLAIDACVFSTMPTLNTLTNVQYLQVQNCPNITSIPELPPNLSASFSVYNCPITSLPSIGIVGQLQISSTAITSGPDCGGNSTLVLAVFSFNNSMTTAPNFSSATALATATVNNNNLMATAPSFEYCSSLIQIQVSGNPLMTSPPNLYGCDVAQNISIVNNATLSASPSLSFSASLGVLDLYNNPMLSTVPGIGGFPSIYHIDLNGCGVTDLSSLDSLGNSAAGNASSYGIYGGYFNVSGGTNAAFDSSSLPGWIYTLQSQGWTVIYNSY